MSKVESLNIIWQTGTHKIVYFAVNSLSIAQSIYYLQYPCPIPSVAFAVVTVVAKISSDILSI
jgi:hypothetical protein